MDIKENMLVFPEKENISFAVEFTADDEVSTLPEGYKYYFRVKAELDGERLIDVRSESNSFDVYNNLEVGTYFFEVGMTNGETEIVICPAVNHRNVRISELIITRRL